MNFAIICKEARILLVLKSLTFVSLAAIFYVFYFTEVVNKFAERDTTLVNSQETLEKNERNPPFITFCMTPRAKNSILDGYKLSHGVLNGPNSNDKKILTNLNKTIEALFREVTFKLNRDFYLTINLWLGWDQHAEKMTEGSNNYIKVQIILT